MDFAPGEIHFFCDTFPQYHRSKIKKKSTEDYELRNSLGKQSGSLEIVVRNKTTVRTSCWDVTVSYRTQSVSSNIVIIFTLIRAAESFID